MALLLTVSRRILQFFQKFIKLNNTDHSIDSIYLQGMKRSLAEKEMMSQGDYIIVDKPTSFDIFPYRNKTTTTTILFHVAIGLILNSSRNLSYHD